MSLNQILGFLNKHRSENGHNHFYNGEIGLRIFRTSVAKAKSSIGGIKNVNLLSDSIGEGGTSDANPNNWPTTGYAGKIRTRINTLCSDVGLGFIPVYAPYLGTIWNFVGTWGSAGTYGPTATNKATATNGDTATLNFNGTGLRILAVKGPSGAEFSVSIDGGAATTFDTMDGGAIDTSAEFEINGLGAGDHVATITAICGVGELLVLLGAYALKGTNGIRINNMSKWGTGVSSNTGAAAIDAAITHFSPILTILAYGGGDYIAQTAIQTFKNDLITLVNAALVSGDVLLISDGNNTDSYAIPLTEYAKAMKEVAIQKGVAFFDLVNRWGGSGTFPNAQGLLVDNVHPNLAGHEDIARAVLNVLLEDR